jgi:hypothetical protein
MRLFVYCILLTLLASCSSINFSNIAPGYRDAFQSLENYFFAPQDKLSFELINNIPYASATLQIGRGPKGLIILESKINKKYNWVSADGIIITTNKFGKIVGTSGLINNLNSIESSVESLNKINQENTYTSYYTLNPPKLNLLPVTSVFTYHSYLEIDLLKGKTDLKQVNELISNQYLGWKNENKFWIDEDGFIWKSKQYISPKLPPFYLEITKKPAI